MSARGLATCAAIAALTVAGCGGDEPAPFKEVKQPTASTPTATVDTPATDADPLAALSAKQRKALAILASAQAGLAQRGDAVAVAGTDASKLVDRVAAGYTPPSGAVPELRRLVTALSAFATDVGPIATDEELLPQLSTQLQERYTALAKKRPSLAAHVLDAKDEVDSVIAALPGLRDKVDDAAATAKKQLSAAELDADALDQAITNGSAGVTAALNGVNQAVDLGVRALADSA
jgi:hypothetical protein